MPKTHIGHLLRAAFGAVVLRWHPVDGAERYSVTVMSPSLEVLYKAYALPIAELRVPPAALAGQPSAGQVLWRVQAVLPGGRVIESPVFDADFH